VTPLRPGERLLSLDVFRGATIAAMILVNNPGDWTNTYPALLHVDWHGWTFTDTIFPFFLWIVGVAMTFSFAKRVERGDDRGRLWLHTLKRAALIFLVGLFLNGFPTYNLATIRIPGVLQRIAICYLAGATIFLFTKIRGQVIAIVALLAGYWMLMTLVPVPGFGPGVLTPEGNLSTWVDQRLFPGHMWSVTKIWDPEGSVSTLPSIATLLFGALAGHLLRSQKSAAEKAAWLMCAGALVAGAGTFLDHWMPINKKIWTTSFCLLMAGLASLCLGVWFWLLDVVKIERLIRYTRPFAIYGMNAIAVYVMSGVLARILGRTGASRWLWIHVFTPAASPMNASLLYALANVLVLYLVAYVMYRRGWFVRL
jgi:predicted acyltransferase